MLVAVEAERALWTSYCSAIEIQHYLEMAFKMAVVCLLDPRESVSTDPARSHLQRDEFISSCSDAVHSVGSRVRLA